MNTLLYPVGYTVEQDPDLYPMAINLDPPVRASPAQKPSNTLQSPELSALPAP